MTTTPAIERRVRAVLRLYPRQWHRDGRVEEIDEILRETLEHSTRREAALEIANLAGHALSAQARGLAPVGVRARVASLSGVFGGALAGLSFLLGEWQPWADQNVISEFGPFETWASSYYLAWIAMLAALLTRHRRVLAATSALGLVIGSGCLLFGWAQPVVWPAGFRARPLVVLVVALMLFNVGVCWGATALSTLRRRWTGVAGIGVGLLLFVVMYLPEVQRSHAVFDFRFSWTYRPVDRFGPFINTNATLQHVPGWFALIAVLGGVVLTVAERWSMQWLTAALLASLPVWTIFVWQLPDRQRPAVAVVVGALWLTGAVRTTSLSRRTSSRRSDEAVTVR